PVSSGLGLGLSGERARRGHELTRRCLSDELLERARAFGAPRLELGEPEEVARLGQIRARRVVLRVRGEEGQRLLPALGADQLARRTVSGRSRTLVARIVAQEAPERVDRRLGTTGFQLDEPPGVEGLGHVGGGGPQREEASVALAGLL